MAGIRKTIILIVVIQLSVIAYLGFKISRRKKTISVVPMSRHSIVVKGTENLKYYYDLNPNTTGYMETPWLPEKATYTTNDDALHERFDYQARKPKDTFRIITLGDSYTYGALISTPFNWTELLEDKLNAEPLCGKYKKTEVINLGVGGYDIEYAVERYRQRGLKYNPDLIIWMLVDKSRILEKLRPYITECSKQLKTDYIKNVPDYSCWHEAAEILTKKYGQNYIDQYLATRYDGLFDLYNGKIIAVNLDGYHNGMFTKVKQGADKTSILRLSYDADKSIQLLDGHPNKKGHRYFADSIYNFISEKRIILCE